MTVGPVDPGVKIAVSKATVELRGFHHSAPRDVDVLLVAPNGRQVLLMSDAGGAGAVSSRNYLFDDAAAAGLSTTANSASGTYKPTNVGTTTDAFPAPAPAPFGAAYPTTLGGLAGTDPQGAWRLYVQDDLNGSDDTSGAISNGWRLNLTLVDATPDPGDDPGDVGGGGCGDDEADPDCTGVDGSLPPGTDTTKPNGGFKVSLDLKKSFKRRAIKKGFKVKVRVKIPGSLVRASIVKAPRKKGAREGSFKFAKKRKTAAKAGLVTLTLKPGRKARQKLRRALDAKGKVKLRMRVLVDPPGAIKAATKRRNFTLKTG